MAEVPIKAQKPAQLVEKPKAMILRTHYPAAVQEKIFNAFILAAKVAFKSDQGNPDHFLKDGFFTTDKYIVNFSGIKTKNGEHISESIHSLQKRILIFDYLDGDKKLVEQRMFAPISEIRFLPDGRLNFFLPPSIIEALHSSDPTYNIDITLAGRLTSVYAIAIYEMGLLHMGGMVSLTMPQLREYMGLTADEYPRNADLKRYVIDKGCDEVNLKCGMVVSYRLIQEGQGNKTKEVEFSFAPASEPVEIPADSIQLELVATFCAALQPYLNGEPFVISTLKQNLEAQGEEWVLSNVEAFLTRMKAPGMPPVKSIGGLFRTVFKNDYGKDIRDAKRVNELIKKRKSGAVAKAIFLDEDADLEAYRLKSEKYLAYFFTLAKTEQKEIQRKISLQPMITGPADSKIVFYLSEMMGVVL